MAKTRKTTPGKPLTGLEKCPSGISGLDQITHGGLPRGRTTLVCGGPGTGKTLFGMEFLIKGIMEHGETGVFFSFEERTADLAINVASMGIDVEALSKKKKLAIDYINITRSEFEEAGTYDLDGLFIRLGQAIDAVGAKRIVLDATDVLFANLDNVGILRTELRRLFHWLNDRGVTTIITGERGRAGELTRNGLEEYVSDCVILLDQRVRDQTATRYLRIIKYRGSAHGTTEYPFLLGEQGFTVEPISSISLDYTAPTDFVSSGIPSLDGMLGGHGYYRGGTLMVSGTAGTGKSSIAASYIDAACRRRERCLYFAFEESSQQIVRNMRSIGLDLQPWLDNGRLHIQVGRPTSSELERNLTNIQVSTELYQPKLVVLDPVSSFGKAGSSPEVTAMLMRLIDFFKARQITVLLTSLLGGADPEILSEMGISSMIDAWLLLRNLEQAGERTRLIYVLKARGIAHSNEVREFVLSDNGVSLLQVYMGPQGILTGSARAVQEMQDRSAMLELGEEIEGDRHLIERKRKLLKSRIAEIEAEFEDDIKAMELAISRAERSANIQRTTRVQAGEQEGSATAGSKPRKSRKRPPK